MHVDRYTITDMYFNIFFPRLIITYNTHFPLSQIESHTFISDLQIAFSKKSPGYFQQEMKSDIGDLNFRIQGLVNLMNLVSVFPFPTA
jgi:hypothetical protein